MNNEQLVKALAYWRRNPVEAIKDWFNVTPEDYQADIVHTLLGPNSGNRTVAKSGHGVGKTTTEAWCGWIFLVTRSHARVPCTAPTQSQLKDILWPEFAKWWNKFPDDLKSMWDISETHIRHKEAPKTWFAVARTSNKPENLQGFHNDHVLVLIDEGSGVPAPVFEVVEGILTNASEFGHEAKLLMAGNPTQTAGEFYNAFNRNKLLYNRFTISGDKIPPKDPNGGKIYVSNRVTDAYRDTMARKYGLTSAVYDVRVRGLFPTMADDVVIPLAWAEAAARLELPVFDAVGDAVTFVMDVARFGGDETTLGTFRRGHCLSIKAWPKTSTNECVDILFEAHNNCKYHVGRIIVDEPGIGGGVVDVATRVGLAITPYHGGATLKNDHDPDDEIRMFANRRSRDWWHARRQFEQGLCAIPDDEVVINQLASVKFQYNMRDRIQVETKGEMRDRLGEDASPDRADTIVMGLAPYHSLIGAIPNEILVPENIILGADRPTANQDF